ncbi:MAG: U32 family peptidase [Peptococcaceae bacterium]|nr:U32 family peptidase [Peptococcaceae bacterium]
MRTLPELLAPAGTPEKLVFALQYGADAVYAAGPQFGLRAHAGNFTLSELAEGIQYAHGLGRKVYVTVNIIPHNDDLKELPMYLEAIAAIGADAIILSDPGVLMLARKHAPLVDLHLSTQANAVNHLAARFWQEQGIKRVVLARELSGAEISEIRGYVPEVELEMFIHGAMCISYSGRCLLSNYMTGRDANKGECAHPCRYQYALVEEKRPGQYFPIEEDARGAYIMNSKDLCLYPYLADILQLGLQGLKIEGRMKSVYYVATITRAYRLAIDALARGELLPPQLQQELTQVNHRDYTGGFFLQKPTSLDHLYEGNKGQGEAQFLGIVRGFDPEYGLLIEQRGHFRLGTRAEIISPLGGPWPIEVVNILDRQTLHPLEAARHAQQLVFVPYHEPVPEYSILRASVPPRFA